MGHRDQAEDVVQEAFVRIWNSASQYDANLSAPMTWMVSITRNKAIDQLRKHREEPLTDEQAQALFDQAPSAHEQMESHRDAKALQRCLDTLEGMQRQSIITAYFHGASHGDLVTQLAAPLGPVKSWIRRAMERLLGLRILPIVNENDTVATHEIRFGDNDRLAALVAELIGADALVLLSDIECLYTRPPSEPGALPIDTVAFGDDLAGFEFGSVVVNSVGTGGAATKVSAARLAAAAGIGVLVTSADLVVEALSGGAVGTWFAPDSDATPGAATGNVRTGAIAS